MNLIVDIGNSFIKVAVVERDEVLELRRYQSLEEFAGSNIVAEFPFLQRAIVASTAMATREVAELLEKWGLWVLEMTPATPVPIGNGYLTPETLGVDRLAAAVGAVSQVGESCLIVDFGSAITIDLVENGVFRGGNISPGVEMRFRALHDYTKRLPKCEPTDEILELGRTTSQAIEQGVMQGITHEIEGYISGFYAKNVKLSLIFTGGDAKYFVKRIKNAIFAKYDLVICGLNRILEYNAKTEQEDI
jgi:type III pantothenate kinase